MVSFLKMGCQLTPDMWSCFLFVRDVLSKSNLVLLIYISSWAYVITRCNGRLPWMEVLQRPLLPAALRQGQGCSFASCYMFSIILWCTSVAVKHKLWSSSGRIPLQHSCCDVTVQEGSCCHKPATFLFLHTSVVPMPLKQPLKRR